VRERVQIVGLAACGLGGHDGLLAQQLDQTWRSGQPEDSVETGSPQIAVDKKHPCPFTRERNRQIGSDEGLPFLRRRAGHQNGA
jgi:hypothetical protein